MRRAEEVVTGVPNGTRQGGSPAHRGAAAAGRVGNPRHRLARILPAKKDKIQDSAPGDGASGNFGRLARYGMMKEYVAEMLQTPLQGIPVKAWLNFFKKFGKETTRPGQDADE